VYDPGEASTPADIAYVTSVPTPPEARQLRVASYEYQQARFTFVRFSAPVDVCQKYATTVMPKMILKSLNWDQKHNDLMTIYVGEKVLHGLNWFDLPYATAFWTQHSGKLVFREPTDEEILESPEIVGADQNTELKGYSRTAVRVDVLRGVFYYLQVN
jgi:hypothetical protein